jgi:hypothetical protein
MKNLLAILPLLFLGMFQLDAQTCQTPIGLAANNLTSSSADLSWNSVPLAQTYSMQYRVQGTPAWTTVANILTNAFPLTGLSASTAYEFKVRAECSGGNNSSYSAEQAFTTPAVCPVPAGLAASSLLPTSATLSWGTVSGASSYTLQWALQNSGNWTTVAGLTTTSYDLTGLSAVTGYQFKVRALCGGSNYGDYSAATDFTTPAVCNTPTGLSATGITSSSAMLNWGTVSGATTYSLQWALQNSSNWTTVAGLTSTSYNLTGLSANTGYQFKLRAECGGGNNSDYSSAVNFSTLALCAMPTNLVANNIQPTSADLTWSDVNGADEYHLMWSPAQSGNWDTISHITASNYSLTGLSASTEYQFRVQAFCGNGNNSEYTDAFTFTTSTATSCETPTGLVVRKFTDEEATFLWETAPSAISYTLRYTIQGWANPILIENIYGTSYKLTGLLKEANYSVEVRSNCANNGHSDYSSPVDFTARSFKITASSCYDGVSAMLRWAPLDFETWRWGNEFGYKLERMTKKIGGVELSVSDQLASLTSLNEVVMPITESEFETLAENNEMAGLAAGLIYGDSLEVINYDSLSFTQVANLSTERDARFGFGLFAADNSFEVSKAMGLGFIDESAKYGEEYLYIVTLNQLQPGAANGRAVTDLLIEGEPSFPAPQNLKAIPGDKEAILIWDKHDIDKYFTSYEVVKSSDGGETFAPVSDLPLIFSSSLAENPLVAEFFDTLEQNNVTYIYKVRGKTPFDRYGAYSDTIHVIGKPAPLQAELTILEVVDAPTTPGALKIKWSFPGDLKEEITGFDVYRSKEIEGGFVKINTSALNSSAFEFVDTHPLPVNYYKVVTHDLNGYEISSIALLGQPMDSIPPGAPIGVSGTCDKYGKVTLHWAKNVDSDLMGYRVFMSNAANGDFAQITGAWINDTTFTYYINLKALNEKVFFAIKALDHRENTSALSAPCEVQRPDIIPPAPPTISNVTTASGVVNFEWVLSSSTDVVQYDFQRKRQGAPQWEPLLTFIPNDNVLNFTDTTASYKFWYNYRLLAKDEAGLVGSSKMVKARPVDNGLRDSIQDFTGVYTQLPGAISDVVFLHWDYVHDLDLEGFVIYRGIDSNDIRAFKFITLQQAGQYSAMNGGGGLAFVDTDLDFANVPVQNNYLAAGTITNSGGNPYSGSNVFPINPNIPNNPQNGVTLTYKVMAKFMDGGMSPLTEKVVIQL